MRTFTLSRLAVAVNEHGRALPLSNSPNKLLARLPSDEYRRLLPHLETIHLRPKHVLLGPLVPTGKIYFLGGGLCTITASTEDGQKTGVAMVGSEGILGLRAFDSDSGSPQTVIVEIADVDVQVMDMTTFWAEMKRGGVFTALVHRYVQAFTEGLMQSVLCNALHAVEKRCARCLLDIQDRVGGNEFLVTQELLASMLGVRRASVTLAAATLRRAGLINQAPRHITIRNAAGLEAAACECYAVVKKRFDRLLS